MKLLHPLKKRIDSKSFKKQRRKDIELNSKGIFLFCVFLSMICICKFRFELKHAKQLEEAKAGSQAAVKELEQLQNEKR